MVAATTAVVTMVVAVATIMVAVVDANFSQHIIKGGENPPFLRCKKNLPKHNDKCVILC